jgi:Peptidase family M3
MAVLIKQYCAGQCGLFYCNSQRLALTYTFPAAGLALQLVESMHGVRFVPTLPKPSVWRPDVDVVDVVDAASGKKLAVMYMDLFARPGGWHWGQRPSVCAHGRS